MIGQILLSVFLILLGVAVFLLLLPVGIRVRYHEGVLKLWYCFGPLRFSGVPGKKAEQPKPKQNDRSGIHKVVDEHVQANRTDDSPLGNFLAQIKTVLGLFWALKPKLKIKRLEIKLHLAGEDPCAVALLYGGAWAALGALVPLLEEAFILKKRDLDVDCRFDGGSTTVDARLDLTVGLGRLLYILLRYSFDTLGKADQKKTKGGKINEPKHP